MFIEIIVAITLGVYFGVFTGLTPGIHINLISAMLVQFSAVLLGFSNVLSLSCFIIAMSITHSFLDTIPSVFLGAPDSATALGVLPGHRYLLRGKGAFAVKLTVLGSFGGLVVSTLFFPVFLWIVHFYEFIQPFIGYILLAVVIFMILRDNKPYWAVFVFLLSGCFGLSVLNIANFDPMFPMLSGIFGVATLLMSLNESETIPPQKEHQQLNVHYLLTGKALLSGTFSGFLTAVFPGLGSATAAVLSLQITKNLGDYGFMILLGAISTVNFFLSLVTFYALGKARNGSILAVRSLLGEITFSYVLVFIGTALLSGGVAVYLAFFLTEKFSYFISRISYAKLILGIIFFIVALSFVFGGFLGFFVLLVGTTVGLIPAIIKVTRTHAMGCLLLPVMLYFL